MSRRTLTLMSVRSVLRVDDANGVRLGRVERVVTHSVDNGCKVSSIRFVAITHCQCVAAASVHRDAASEDDAADWVEAHMALPHPLSVQVVRGVA